MSEVAHCHNNMLRSCMLSLLMQQRQGKGKARQGKARQGKARQGKARQGKARQGKARRRRTCSPALLLILLLVLGLSV